MRLINSLLTAILTLATSLCLAYALFGAGLVVCTTPQATSALGNTFAGWEDSVFPEDDMATLAEAARSFSIEGTSEEELYNTISTVVAQNSPDLLAQLGFDAESIEATAQSSTANAGADESTSDATADSADTADAENNALAQALKEASSSYVEQYSLPAQAVSHLQDCTPLFQTGRISTGVVAGFGLVGLIALGLLRGRKRVGAACIAAASLVFALLVVLGVWALLDFDSLFTWMHTLLFAQGNWTFPSNSLLIQLFPEAFWAAMAGLWVITSALCALVVLIIGKLLARR